MQPNENIFGVLWRNYLLGLDQNIRSGKISPQSYLSGLQTSNDAISPATVMNFTAGQAAADLTSPSGNIILPSAWKKSISGPWVQGTGQPGLGNGLTATPSAWYHEFAILLSDGTSDIYFDTSIKAANAPSAAIAYRRIGTIALDPSAHIVPVSQNGDEFLWFTPRLDVNAVGTSAGQATYTVSVPPDIKVWARLRGLLVYQTATVEVLIYPPDVSPQSAGSPGGANYQLYVSSTLSVNACEVIVRTNTSEQIIISPSSSGALLYLITYGWIDQRGRNN